MDIAQIIKYEGDDKTLVYKSPIEDFNTTTQLIVHESQEAIFFRDGQALDTFGPGRHTLETQNIPLLKKIINIPTDGKTPFHCEVYFINKAAALDVKWGTTSKFEVLDPKFFVQLNVGASGAMEFKIKDSRKFLIKLVGTQKVINTTNVVEYFKEKIVMKVKANLSKVMSEVSYVVVNQHLEEISEALKTKLYEEIDEYLITVMNFYLSTVYISDEEKAKVQEVLNKKMEQGILGYNWMDEQMADIAKRYADNPGTTNNVTGMMAQMPMAMAFGQMLTGVASPMVEKGFSGGTGVTGISLSDPTAPKPEVKKSFCSECGNEISLGDKFCSNCGKEVKMQDDTCSKCGKTLDEDDKFCPDCGTKRGE